MKDFTGLMFLGFLACMIHTATSSKICGGAESKVEASLEAAWEVAADFYELEKWVPSIQKCEKIPPDVRYCKSFMVNGSFNWVKEQLFAINETEHTLSYRVVDGNFGLVDYEATMSFTELSSQDKSCNLKWSFCMDESSPRSKATQEAYLQFGIRSLEKAAAAADEVQNARVEL